MATSKISRLTSEDLLLSFGVIAFPLHVWAIINILQIFPAWLLRLSLWELAGGISYPLVDAFLESLLLWLVLAGLGFALPKKWLADHFVAESSSLAWLLAGWAILLQYNFGRLLQWGPEQMIPALLLVIASITLVFWLVQRFARLRNWIQRGAQSLAVVTYVYMLFDLLGLVVILLRNV